MSDVEKFVIIGIDGADFFLTRDLMDRGDLPNLNSLRQRGIYSPLISTIPPLTPQAWSSFACGVNPGKHGIFDFGEIPLDSYESRLNTSEDRKARGFWEYLGAEGLSTSVINMPLTYPAEDLSEGYMIAGMHTPDLESLCAHKEVQKFLSTDFPDYCIDVMSFWYKDMDLFVDRVKNMVRMRTKLVKELRKRFPTDVLFFTFVGLDRVLHAFYSQQDFHTGGQGWKYETVGREVFKLIDDGVGEILSEISSDVPVMVLSDHGFGTLEKDVYLNNFFHQKGYLDFDPAMLTQAMTCHPSWDKGLFGALVFSALARIPFFRKKVSCHQKSFQALDWSKVKCFSTGLFGNVYLHRTDRFPEGWIDPHSSQYEDLLVEVVSDLRKLRLDGEPVVDEVYLSRDIYHGPWVFQAPDIILKMRDYSLITRGGQEFDSDDLADYPGVNHSGNHRMEGILFLSGPGFISGESPYVQAILEDLVPTLLYGLDLPIPLAMDGRVLFKAFLKECEPTFYEETISRERSGSFELNDPQVRARLEALGYLDG
jgi:predicted AlkP superfamily phosphohydrolase/phosphomutase